MAVMLYSCYSLYLVVTLSVVCRRNISCERRASILIKNGCLAQTRVIKKPSIHMPMPIVVCVFRFRPLARNHQVAPDRAAR